MNTETLLHKQSLSIKEKLAILAFINTFTADKKDYRQYLQLVSVKSNRIYATNGHILGIVENVDTEGLKPYITSESIKKASTVQDINLLKEGDLSGTYPDIDRIIPKPDAYSYEAGAIATKYAGTIFTALEKLQKKLGLKYPSIRIAQVSGRQANVFTTSIRKDDDTLPINITIVIMPVRE